MDVEPSGKLGLFLVPISYARSELSGVDLTTGAARRLYPTARSRKFTE